MFLWVCRFPYRFLCTHVWLFWMNCLFKYSDNFINILENSRKWFPTNNSAHMLAKGIFRNLPFRVCCHLDLLVVRPGYPGHSLRLLLSEGDPRVGPVVGSGLYVRPPPQEQVCAWWPTSDGETTWVPLFILEEGTRVGATNVEGAGRPPPGRCALWGQAACREPVSAFWAADVTHFLQSREWGVLGMCAPADQALCQAATFPTPLLSDTWGLSLLLYVVVIA